MFPVPATRLPAERSRAPTRPGRRKRRAGQAGGAWRVRQGDYRQEVAGTPPPDSLYVLVIRDQPVVEKCRHESSVADRVERCSRNFAPPCGLSRKGNHVLTSVMASAIRTGGSAAAVPPGPPAGSAGVRQQAAGAPKAQAEAVEWPVDVALARPVTQLPTGRSWAYEIKLWTGLESVRCPPAQRAHDGATIRQSGVVEARWRQQRHWHQWCVLRICGWCGVGGGFWSAARCLRDR